MRRSLFAREFRSALVPNLVTAGAILATLVVLERLSGLRLGKAEDVRAFTDFALLVGLAVSGFISGERCFPAELKESRILFLFSLPISRSWVWLVIVSARLLAALASLAIVVAIRRPLLDFREDASLLQLDIGLVVAQILLAYILFFSMSTLFTLLFRRTLFSYVAGFLALGILLSEAFFSSGYSTKPPQLTELTVVPIAAIKGSRLPPLFTVFVSILLVLSLLLSWRFFVLGEIGNPKRRIKNQLLFGITSTSYLGLVFCVATSTRLASLGSIWTEIRPSAFLGGRELPCGVSSEGRYLFAFESLDSKPSWVRVSIVDTQTGRVTGQPIYGGVHWGFWSGQGDVLNLLVLNNSPLNRRGYLIPGTIEWIRLSPDAREVSKLRLHGVEEVKTLMGGRALVVLRERGQGRVLLLDGTSGRSSELVRAPLDGKVKVLVQEDTLAALVYFDNVLLPRRAWAVDSLAHEVRVPQSSLKTTYVLFGEVFESYAEIQAFLQHRFGSPSTRGGSPMRGKFLLPLNQIWISTEPGVQGLYFLDNIAPDASDLWARSTDPEGRWEKLPHISPNLMRLLEISFEDQDAFLTKFIDFASGTGVFLSSASNAEKVFVYDPRLGVTFKEKSCAPGRTFLNIGRVPGLSGILIGWTCLEKNSLFEGQTHYFEYLPGSREVRAIKTVPVRPSAGPWQLYLDERGLEVWAPLGKGTHQEIWRSFPGTTDLRLWPLRAI
jgi:hypothetical protein